MKRTVWLRAEAERDLAAAASWYEQQRADLGHELLNEVLAALQLIAEKPLAYPLVHRDTRRARAGLDGHDAPAPGNPGRLGR